jgi:hypothetical protein
LAIFWLNLCIVFVLINAAAALHLRWFPPDESAPLPDYVEQALSIIYHDWSEEDVETLVSESTHGFVPEALVQFREKSFAGRFVNTDENGFRRVAKQGPWPPSKEHFNVYLLGGSTALGYGVADEHTIASLLQERLEGMGLSRPPRVYNFARGSFYSTQERLLFDKLVTVGTPPDLAIFLDGLNDFFYREDPPPLTREMTVQGEERLERPIFAAIESTPMLRWFRERQALRRFGDGKPRATESDPEREREAASRVIDRYIHNKAIIEALAASRAVEVAFVWQPVPTYGYDLRHHVYDGQFGRHELSRVGYPLMRTRVAGGEVGENFYWCADLQQGAETLLYVDLVHYSPAFSADVAGCIADHLARTNRLD